MRRGSLLFLSTLLISTLLSHPTKAQTKAQTPTKVSEFRPTRVIGQTRIKTIAQTRECPAERRCGPKKCCRVGEVCRRGVCYPTAPCTKKSVPIVDFIDIWKYYIYRPKTSDVPPSSQKPEWFEPNYNDSKWKVGKSPFGNKSRACKVPYPENTYWPARYWRFGGISLYLRKKIYLPPTNSDLIIKAYTYYDNHIIGIYINGHKVLPYTPYPNPVCKANTQGKALTIKVPKNIIKPGYNNTLAIWAYDGGVQSYFTIKMTAIVLECKEVCDGKDNDGDGLIDESDPHLGKPCKTGKPGICGIGKIACIKGKLVCIGPKPQLEVCDGKDNDCDGQIDESDPNLDKECKTGKPGICKAGNYKCIKGQLVCVGPKPQLEVCDGKDNDCDGEIDESDPKEGEKCETDKPGICKFGELVCVKGKLLCKTPKPQPEVCDGKDNDCDGEIDESDPNLDKECKTGKPGICGIGKIICIKGQLVCVGPKPQLEVCDGKDNDCDGLIDESDPNLDKKCETGKPGICKFGEVTCIKGKLVCVGPKPDKEVCDGKDNDCDGLIDESDPNLYKKCMKGEEPNACNVGEYKCIKGNLTCIFPEPQLEVCDGKDNDCDGQVDESDPNLGKKCTIDGKEGICAEGKIFCIKGKLVCKGNKPEKEICDGKDNDCDGLVDEEFPEKGKPCGDKVCSFYTCNNGTLICETIKAKVTKIVDFIDTWKYYIYRPRTSDAPPSTQKPEWFEPNYNDSKWKVGKSPFGNKVRVCKVPYPENTYWPARYWRFGGISLYLRKKIYLPPTNSDLIIKAYTYYDNNIMGIYINGHKVLPYTPYSKIICRSNTYGKALTIKVPKNIIKPGPNNILAIWVYDGGVQSYFTIKMEVHQECGPEICDGKDNDLDGQIDEGFPINKKCCMNNSISKECCGVFTCSLDGKGVMCKVPNPKICATKDEVCNGIDDDGDGLVDEGFDVGESCCIEVKGKKCCGKVICKEDGDGSFCYIPNLSQCRENRNNQSSNGSSPSTGAKNRTPSDSSKPAETSPTDGGTSTPDTQCTECFDSRTEPQFGWGCDSTGSSLPFAFLAFFLLLAAVVRRNRKLTAK